MTMSTKSQYRGTEVGMFIKRVCNSVFSVWHERLTVNWHN